MPTYIAKCLERSVDLAKAIHTYIWIRLYTLDKAPCLSISIVILILSSDSICQLNQLFPNSEAAMLSILGRALD